jgi:hypothetical protein
MKIPKFALVAITFACIFSGCKEKEVYPPETQDGRNTFGVRIDGNKWLPNQASTVPLAPDKLKGEYLKEGGIVAITARRDNNDEIIVLTIADVNKTGIYAFNDDSSKSTRTEFRGDKIDDKYRSFSGGINEVNITKLDTINKIVSGNFKIQLKGLKNSAIKNLTEGIFDIKYEN